MLNQFQKQRPDCPKGYRLLLQMPEAASVIEAKEELCRIFGEAKASHAVFRPGYYNRNHLYQEGFRAFIPLNAHERA